MSSSTVYFISGANRGIGFSIVKSLISRPNTVIFAGVRDPSKAVDLNLLASQNTERLFVVKFIYGDEESNRKAVEEIKNKFGKVDVVLANAGVGGLMAPTSEVTLSSLREHFEVNSLGPILLFQSILPLLLKSAAPKFVVVSSVAGSIDQGAVSSFPMVAYGVSKVGVNWFTKRVHFEYADKGLVAFPIHPGLVDTDMARNHVDSETLKTYGAISPDTSAESILKVVDNATVEKDGGVFRNFDGTVLPW